jgi:hypothetical protein
LIYYSGTYIVDDAAGFPDNDEAAAAEATNYGRRPQQWVLWP